MTSRQRRTPAAVAVLAAVLAVTGGLVWLGAAPALAHANLVRAVPGDGATVTTAPGRVRLVFDENVRTPAAVVVTGPTGRQVEQGQVWVLDNTANVRVDVTAAGRYTVAFRVVSADGHPVSARTTFRFTPGGSAQPGTRAEHAGHDSDADGGSSPGRVIAIVAALGLLAGLALLTVRRMPGGIVNPGRSPDRRGSP